MLIGPGGMALYIFEEDEVKDGQGTSYCNKGLSGSVAATGGTCRQKPDGRREGPRNARHHQTPGWSLRSLIMAGRCISSRETTKPGDTTGNGSKMVWYLVNTGLETQTAIHVNASMSSCHNSIFCPPGQQ